MENANIDRIKTLLAHAVSKADEWHDECHGGPITGDVLMDEARALVAGKAYAGTWGQGIASHPEYLAEQKSKNAKFRDAMMKVGDTHLPASPEPAVVGRVPTAWLLEHMHSFSQQEFYDQTLSEDDLKAILAKRMP